MSEERVCKVGVTLPQFTDDPSRILEAARRAEELGFDSIWLFDHLWPLSGGKERPVFECWTTLAYLAAATERVMVGTLVTRSSLRHPALLAKMAATVASIAPGRLIVGIGSGDSLSKDENEAFGIPYFSDGERVDQFEETVAVLAQSFTDGSVTLAGDFVDLKDMKLSPIPPESPTVWVAGRSGDATELAGRLADGWNGWSGGPDRFAQDAQEVLAAASGRRVDLTWGGIVRLLPAGEETTAPPTSAEAEAGVTEGTPEHVAGHLRSLTEAGASHLVLTLAGGWRAGDLERLAETRSLI